MALGFGELLQAGGPDYNRNDLPWSDKPEPCSTELLSDRFTFPLGSVMLFSIGSLSAFAFFF